jgi:hypothetical protein
VNALHEQSLRWQVEKWLGLGPSISVQVTVLRRTRWRGTRCVLVQALLPAGSRTLFFFQHDDRSWRVYPPAINKRKLGHSY